MIYGEAKYMIEQLELFHIIDRNYEIDGKAYHLLGIAEADDEHLLMMMSYDGIIQPPDPRLFESLKKNRDHYNSPHLIAPYESINIEWLSIGTQKLFLSGSTSIYDFLQNKDFDLWVDYLEENGVRVYEDTPKNTRLLQVFSRVEGFSVDTPLETSAILTIKTRDNYIQEPCHQLLELTIEDYTEPVALPFLEGEICYINGISIFDKDEGINRMKQGDGKYATLKERLTEIELEELVVKSKCIWDSIMSDDEVYGIITYESKWAGSLDFKLTSYLNTSIKKNGTSTIFLPKLSEQFGLLGLPLKACAIGPIKKNQVGSVSVELIQAIRMIEGREYTNL